MTYRPVDSLAEQGTNHAAARPGQSWLRTPGDGAVGGTVAGGNAGGDGTRCQGGREDYRPGVHAPADGLAPRHSRHHCDPPGGHECRFRGGQPGAVAVSLPHLGAHRASMGDHRACMVDPARPPDSDSDGRGGNNGRAGSHLGEDRAHASCPACPCSRVASGWLDGCLRCRLPRHLVDPEGHDRLRWVGRLCSRGCGHGRRCDTSARGSAGPGCGSRPRPASWPGASSRTSWSSPCSQALSPP